MAVSGSRFSFPVTNGPVNPLTWSRTNVMIYPGFRSTRCPKIRFPTYAQRLLKVFKELSIPNSDGRTAVCTVSCRRRIPSCDKPVFARIESGIFIVTMITNIYLNIRIFCQNDLCYPLPRNPFLPIIRSIYEKTTR